MIFKLFDFLLYIYFLIVVVAALVGWRSRKVLPHPFSWLWVYLLIDVVVELVVFVLRYYNIEFRWLYNLFGMVECFFVGWLYYIYFKKPLERKILIYLLFSYCLFTVLNQIFFQEYFDYHLVFLVRAIVVVAVVLYYFLIIYQNDELLEFNRKPLFWVSFGLFVFFTASLFSMGLGAHIMRMNKELGYAVMLLNPILNIYLYVMFIVSFICSQRNIGHY